MTLSFTSARPRALIAALFSVAILGACSESPTRPTARALSPNRDASTEVTLTVLDGPNSASAQFGAYTDRVNLQIPTLFHAQNPCAGGRFGEIVVYSGNQHLVFQQTSIANGRLSTMLHWNADDVIGIGQFTGFKYQVTGVTQDKVVSGAPLPYTETMTNSYHIIGQGQATNMDLHETVHVTVNANGTMTAWVTDYNFQCHGDASF